jgi:hypothetical protein
MDIISNIIEYLRRNFLLFFLIPILLIGFIYIQYGGIFDNYFSESPEIGSYYHLQTQLMIFSSNINLPNTVKSIGHFTIIFIYITFGIWLISCLLSTYIHLSKQTASKIEILVELVILIFFYVTLIIPDSKIWISVIGGLLIITNLVLLFLYWNYERIIRNEKK